MPPPEFVLHIWPGKWSLPSIDPSCLAAVILFQSLIPGRFALSECVDPDSSPSGHLPYLTHEHRAVSPLPSIIKYLAGHMGSDNSTEITHQDDLLGDVDRAQRVAWYAHIESHLGDLVAYTFYSMHDNYSKTTHLALSSFLPIPQRYYVPTRIREMHRPRLEAAGLWDLPGDEVKQQTDVKSHVRKHKVASDEKIAYKKTFDREKVLQKARSIFTIYTRLLSTEAFCSHDRPTYIDALLCSHILLLITPPFPDTLISNLLTTAYPSLTEHAHRVYTHAFPSPDSLIFVPRVPPVSNSLALRTLIPYLRHPCTISTKTHVKKARTPEDVRFDRMRWGWIGLVLGAAAVFIGTGNLRTQLYQDGDIPEEGGEE